MSEMLLAFYRKPAKQLIKAQESQQVAYEEQLPFLSRADPPTEDERTYVMPQVGLRPLLTIMRSTYPMYLCQEVT